MEQVNCIDFCEIVQYLYEKDPSLECSVHRAMELAGYEKVERIYFGSSFCSQYFLHISPKLIEALVAYCMEKQIKLTMVVPVFSQKDLKQAKEKIQEIIKFHETAIDEITVNDYGMLFYLHNNYSIALQMGRLFMKDYRDLRYEEYFSQTLHPKGFTHFLKQLIKDYKITGLEFDPTHRAIDFSKAPGEVDIGLYYPYCYMTVGHVCEYASLHRKMEQKFRPNASCNSECMSTLVRYRFEDGHDWIRLGRTIFFSNPQCQVQGIERFRLIYSPINMEVMG